jgi:hypothetical protein
MAARRYDTAAMKEICDLAKDHLTREELYNLLFAANNEENSAWHTAVDWDINAAIKEIWDFAKDNLTTEEIHTLLLATNNE